MRATPSSTKSPRPAAATAAVSGRIAVPALPRKSSPPRAGNRPPQPAHHGPAAAQSASTETPSACSADDHEPDVLGVEQVLDGRLALGEGRQQQDAVGEGLGAREADGALDGGDGGEVEGGRLSGWGRRRGGGVLEG